MIEVKKLKPTEKRYAHGMRYSVHIGTAAVRYYTEKALIELRDGINKALLTK